MALNLPNLKMPQMKGPEVGFEGPKTKGPEVTRPKSDEGMGSQERFSAQTDSAKAETNGYINMIRNEKGQYQMAEGADQTVAALEAVNTEIDDLKTRYAAESQTLQQLPPGPKNPELAPLHPAVVEEKVGTKPQTEIPDTEEPVSEEVRTQEAQRVGAKAENATELLQSEQEEIKHLESWPNGSYIFEKLKVMILDQVNRENEAELAKYLAADFKLFLLPAFKKGEKEEDEEAEGLEGVFFIIRLLMKGIRRYLLLINPDYYNQTNKTGEPEVAMKITKLAEALNAEIRLLPKEEAEAVKGGLQQQKDGRTFVPEGAPKTKQLIAGAVGKDKVLSLPAPGKNAEIGQAFSVPKISAPASTKVG